MVDQKLMFIWGTLSDLLEWRFIKRRSNPFLADDQERSRGPGVSNLTVENIFKRTLCCGCLLMLELEPRTCCSKGRCRSRKQPGQTADNDLKLRRCFRSCSKFLLNRGCFSLSCFFKSHFGEFLTFFSAIKNLWMFFKIATKRLEIGRF